jgi:hypothetical protein
MNIGRGVYTGKLFLSYLSYTMLDLREFLMVLDHEIEAKSFTKMDPLILFKSIKIHRVLCKIKPIA